LAVVLKLFPHSWLQIASTSATVYIDPSYLAHFYERHPTRIEYSPRDGLPEQLEQGDLILITHGDGDHMNPATLARLRGEETVVVAPEPCAQALGAFVRPVAEGDELTLLGIGVQVVPAYNTPQGRSTDKHHVRGESVGYVLTVEGKRIYHAGDTDVIAEMGDLGELDVALLPIGATYTMDIDEAIEAAEIIRPKLAVPMHTRAIADPHEFVRKIQKRLPQVKAIAPGIGEPFVIG